MGELAEAAKAISGTMQVADQVGIDDELWARFRSDERYRKSVAQFMQGGAFWPKRHNQYGGVEHVFDFDDWCQLFTAWPASYQGIFRRNMALYEPCPFTNEQREVKSTHFFFWVPSGVEFGQSASMQLTMENQLKLTQEQAHWQNRPKLGIHGRLFVTGISKSVRLSVPQPGWYMVPINSNRLVQDGIPEGYEQARSPLWLLAHILFYQKYSRHLTRREGVCAELTPGNHGKRRVLVRFEPHTDRLVVEANSGPLDLSCLALMRHL